MVPQFDPKKGQIGLVDRLIAARKQFGGKRVILEDQDRKPMTYTDVIRAAFVLGRKIAGLTREAEPVGIMLPTSSGAVITFFALHTIGRVPVMINFTAGIPNVRGAMKAAGVKRVLTARRFVEQAKLDDLVAGMAQDVEIIWLDDIRKTISLQDKMFGLMAGQFPEQFAHKAKPSDTGVILFTSGSFGTPKGVVLTQGNLVSNVVQISTFIEMDPEWVVFNPLPMFHSLGLTGGMFLPLFLGMKAFAYPSPLHVKQIPGLIRETKAALLFATDTFLNQYARASEPEDLSGLKFIVCGAEKVRDETHNTFATRFGGVRVLEGYGVTEASPVLSVNHPEDNHRGTVGPLLPGIEHRLEPVEGIPEGGRLIVRGPNVMAGYLNIERPGVLDAPVDGWYDTGDIVSIDAKGMVRILGRAKRFAKIGGEMVSLMAVERLAQEVWPEGHHAVVAIADPKKGERLVLMTDQRDADLSQLSAHARATGVSELAVPKALIKVMELPVLGSGKTDYVSVQKLVEIEGVGRK